MNQNRSHSSIDQERQALATLFRKTAPGGGKARIRLALPLAGEACMNAGTRTLEDLGPQDGDLIPFHFRLISAAYLGPGGYHLDFSKAGVLEQALPLLQEPETMGSRRKAPLVVVRDHSNRIEDRLGVVRNAIWSPANAEMGLPQPGIDAEIHVNWKLAGDAVRRLLHDPPLIDSCSVSLGFNWEKSHLQLEDWQFWAQLGEEIDGNTVRIIVTEVLSIEHVGLVYAGADPSARRQSRAPAATRIQPDSESPATAQLDPASSPADILLPPGHPLWKKLGIELASLNSLDKVISSLQAGAALGQAALDGLRRDVQRIILQIDGASPSPATAGLHQLVETADWETLISLKADLQSRLEALFPHRCSNCGESQILRRSSRETTRDAARPSGDHRPGWYQ